MTFFCDGSYENDLKIYTEQLFEKFGVSSQIAEREILCLAKAGNTVALKTYADMIFYKKILSRRPYREAFALYMKSAGLTVSAAAEPSPASDTAGAIPSAGSGTAVWSCSGKGYPSAFWDVAYYLVHYHRNSFLQNCEKIADLEDLTLGERLGTALKLSVACIDYIGAAEAVNLVGLILNEVSLSSELFEELKPVIDETVARRTFPEYHLSIGSFDSAADCQTASSLFLITAAQQGYVYACNNLAAREADRIIALAHSLEEEAALSGPGERSSLLDDELKESIQTYITYLKLSAAKYEPYACNRLGLFYMTGEIKGSSDRAVFREYINIPEAKTFFTKATVYPNSNSAWAYYNLIKYFQRDYDTDIELMNEHMSYIEELNPEVYNLAMEL